MREQLKVSHLFCVVGQVSTPPRPQVVITCPVKCSGRYCPQQALLTGASSGPGPQGPQTCSVAVPRRLGARSLKASTGMRWAPRDRQARPQPLRFCLLPRPPRLPRSSPELLGDGQRPWRVTVFGLSLSEEQWSSSSCLYFLLMTFWISAQASWIKDSWGEDDRTACLLCEGRGGDTCRLVRPSGAGGVGGPGVGGPRGQDRPEL